MAPFPASKYSRTSLYITGYLPHLDTQAIKQLFPSYLSTMARATIIEGDLDDIFWPEVVLVMTRTKNIRPTAALEGGNPYESVQLPT